MSVSIELLDAVKASNGGVSDYRAAKMIGVSQPMMSKYRNEAVPMSAEKVILCCKLANLNPLEWLIRLQMERAKCQDEFTLWDDALHRLAA
ncbi:MAG TPA: hypothetical protein PLW86_15965 [Rhodocyclaceae bacterium]|nr:hypothetical protein [Rhodocyclaceae bacterium]